MLYCSEDRKVRWKECPKKTWECGVKEYMKRCGLSKRHDKKCNNNIKMFDFSGIVNCNKTLVPQTVNSDIIPCRTSFGSTTTTSKHITAENS